MCGNWATKGGVKLGLLGLLSASLLWSQGPPTITAVSNAASGVARVTRGSLASVYGLNFSSSSAQPSSLPLPTLLGGVTVSVGGIPAPLVYVSSSQINVQIPFEVSSASSLDVVVTRDGSSSAPFSVPRDEYAPGIFLYARTPTVFDPIIVHAATNELVTPASPAGANELLVVYATGVGALNNPPRSGTASPGAPSLATSVDAATATLGGNPVSVLFAGLTPGLVGLIQFNIQLGALNSTPACQPLVVKVGGSSSPSVNLSTGPGGCSTPVGPPVISVTPSKLDFGSVAPGQPASLLLTVHNTGNSTLIVKSITSSNARFAVTSSVPFQVVADGLAAINVQFAPDSAGTQTGTLTIQSDDAARPAVSIDLAGIGTAPATPALSLSAPSLDFGGVAVGQGKALTLTLRNTGTGPLNVASINTDTTRFSPSAMIFPVKIAAGGQLVVTVQFAPLVTTSYTGTLTITSDYPARPVITVPMTGTGTGGTPGLTLDQNSLDFAGVGIGQSRDLSLVVRSTGSATLIVTDILTGSSPAFQVLTKTPISIPPGSQALVTVRFLPSDPGPVSDAIFLNTTDPNNFSKRVPLSGVGIVP